MKKRKKLTSRILLVFLTIIPIAAFSHFIIFPQETKSILIDFSSFKKDGRIYHDALTTPAKLDTIKNLIQEASIRVANFWGSKTSDSKFIFCSNQEELNNYSVSPDAPAATYLKLGSTIVFGNDGVDLDIISHEISHAELYSRIGFYAFHYKIPSWFKHGLAMQNDYRNYYSEDTLKSLSNNFEILPSMKDLQNDGQFYSGTRDQVMLHYMAASHYVRNWYTREKLAKLIHDLNSGKSFTESFGE